MRLIADRVELDGASASLAGAPLSFGPLQVVIAEGEHPGQHGWSVCNRGNGAVKIRSIAIVFRLEDVASPLRILRHGYQAWSPSGVATFGVDIDPSLTPGTLELIRAASHADQRQAQPGELRSEWVTVLRADGGEPVLVGFDAGTRHDGTLRLRQRADGTEPELWCEAHLGDARLDPGETRELHSLLVWSDGRSAAELLEAWAAVAGNVSRARTHAPYQVGWCSWYHYFHAVTEADLRANLSLASDWPFDVFQLDDGYQAAVGDWLSTNSRFPSSLDQIAAAIAAEGRRPGLWIAPFVVAPDSEVATSHPDWLARLPGGTPLPGVFNPAWGGGQGGLMWTLDTTHPEVDDHLERLGGALVDAGFTYLKLDFTYAPSFDGVWHDERFTPAERVRAGYDAVRRGAGDSAFILGCGAPLAPVVGVVDGNRIGQDVAPAWAATRDDVPMAGYLQMLPATAHAAQSTLARSFMHRQLWLNDPDCLMLRHSETSMTPEAIEGWARIVGLSGGMTLVSDDLSLLDAGARRLLEEVTEIGRASDAAAKAGRPARCLDLLDASAVGQFEAAGYRLTVDPATGACKMG
jgi:alpha-galactosidase